MDYIRHETDPDVPTQLYHDTVQTPRVVPLEDAFRHAEDITLSDRNTWSDDTRSIIEAQERVLTLPTTYYAATEEEAYTHAELDLAKENLFDEWDHRPVQYHYHEVEAHFNSLYSDADTKTYTLKDAIERLQQCQSLTAYWAELKRLYEETTISRKFLGLINQRTTEAVNRVFEHSLNVDIELDNFLVDWGGLDGELSTREAILEGFGQDFGHVVFTKINEEALDQTILGGYRLYTVEAKDAALKPNGALGAFHEFAQTVIVLGRFRTQVIVPWVADALSLRLDNGGVVYESTTPALYRFVHAMANRAQAIQSPVHTIAIETRDGTVLNLSRGLYVKDSLVLHVER
jgi:hypothetical protein